MTYEIIEAKYVRDFIIWVRFDDGVEGEIDFKPELYGRVFEPLLDPSQFRNFSIHPEFRTLAWQTEPMSLLSFCTKRLNTIRVFQAKTAEPNSLAVKSQGHAASSLSPTLTAASSS